MKRRIFSILFTLVLVLSFSLMIALPAAAVPGNTYYVSTTGDNGNDGLSWATALRDIQFAIDKPLAYTINVAAGTYYEHITLVDGVDVLGAGASVTTINGTGMTGTVVTANDVGSGTKIDGFTITKGSGSSTNGCGMRNSNSSPEVTNCIFYDNDGGSGNGGGMYNENSSPTVINCVFSGNYNATGGGMANNGSSPTVTNCTFYNNIVVQYGNGMYNSNSSSPVVTNCIFWDTGGEIANFSSAPVVTYCDVRGGYGAPEDHNINADPLFVGAGDFHLQATSPCLDVGYNSAPSLPSTDFEGDPRIWDGNDDATATVDMGADEYLTEAWVDDDWQTGGLPYAEDTDGDARFATITAAVNAVAVGGTVHVYPGTYNEKIITIDKSLTVESVSGDWRDTIVDPTIGPVFEFASNFTGDATISGFTITLGTCGIAIAGLDGGSVTVDNCFIYGNDTGIYGSGTLDGDIFIDNCIISRNGVLGTGIHLTEVAGTVEITDSVIGAYWDSETETSYSGNGGDGIQISAIAATGNVLIDNNKIVGNTGNGIADQISGCHGQLTITNNIIGAYDYDLTSEDGYFNGNNYYGITIDYVAGTGFVNIEGNKIADNYWGIEFGSGFPIAGDVIINNNYIGAWTDYTTVGEVLYTRTYPGNDSVGIYVLTVDEDGSLIIINNKVAENSYSIPNDTGIHIANTSGDTIISANYVGSWTQDIPGGSPVTHQGNGGPGILVGYVGINGSLLIHGNTVAENTEEFRSGIHIDAANEAADISVNLNNILNNIGDGVYYSGADLSYINAENNWWGDTSGPGGEGPGTGDEVSANVNYAPWLGAPLELPAVHYESLGAGTHTVDASDEADTTVTITTTGPAEIYVARYASQPFPDEPFPDEALGKFIDIYVDNPGNVEWSIYVELSYTDGEVAAAGIDESTLGLYYYEPVNTFHRCSDTGVDTVENIIWANVTAEEAGYLVGAPFGGGGETPVVPPTTGGGDTTDPIISNVLNCYDGVTVTTADVCWTTNERSTSQVEYWASPALLSTLDKTLVTQHNVQLTGLTPNTTYYYQTMSRDAAGNLAVSDVYSFTTLGEGSVATLGEASAATFASSDLCISPIVADIGETVTVSVVVTNTGNLAGSYELTLKINDEVEATEELTLDANASEDVSFTVSREAAGSYSVAIDDLSGSFTVTEPAVSQTDEIPAIGGTSVNWPLVGGIIAGVVVVGLIIFLVVRRARGYVCLWIR